MDARPTVKILKKGGIGVFPTDTIYGLIGSALSRKSVERIYAVRKRNPRKPCIILIHSLKDLELFAVKITGWLKRLLNTLWPGKVSVLLPCHSKKFSYLHRDTKKLAFRLPADKNLRLLIKKVGPLVAPSANLEGLAPAKNIQEAKKYFGDSIDFYISKGTIDFLPSTLIEIKNRKIFLRRPGAVKVNVENAI